VTEITAKNFEGLEMNLEQYIKDRAILDSDEKVVIKELWKGRYRVNVWKHNPNRISRSYFVRVHESGIECNPDLGA
jgi:endo-alpha-1,4-polygalactosaminidase (GH114 family)